MSTPLRVGQRVKWWACFHGAREEHGAEGTVLAVEANGNFTVETRRVVNEMTWVLRSHWSRLDYDAAISCWMPLDEWQQRHDAVQTRLLAEALAGMKP